MSRYIKETLERRLNQPEIAFTADSGIVALGLLEVADAIRGFTEVVVGLVDRQNSREDDRREKEEAERTADTERKRASIDAVVEMMTESLASSGVIEPKDTEKLRNHLRLMTQDME
jgi:hypothetical protein